MSLSYRPAIDRRAQNAPSKPHFSKPHSSKPHSGFVLILICIALSLAVLSAVLTPASIGKVPANDVSLIGP